MSPVIGPFGECMYSLKILYRSFFVCSSLHGSLSPTLYLLFSCSLNYFIRRCCRHLSAEEERKYKYIIVICGEICNKSPALDVLMRDGI